MGSTATPCHLRNISGDSKELLENAVLPLVERFLNKRGLQLSREKTKITHINEGFDFLGQHLRKYGDTMLVTPSKKNVHAFFQKVKTILQSNGNATQDQLIWQLNPVLRGWANYHRHASATRVFSRMDNIIWYALRRWAKRRHPTKSFLWIATKYWHDIGGQSAFAADTGERTREGKPIWNRIVSLSRTRIVRHIKIRGDANPFDLHWDGYFEERALFKHLPLRHSPDHPK